MSGFCLLLAMTSLLEGVTSNCELCHKPGWRCHGATASVTLVTVSRVTHDGAVTVMTVSNSSVMQTGAAVTDHNAL